MRERPFGKRQRYSGQSRYEFRRYRLADPIRVSARGPLRLENRWQRFFATRFAALRAHRVPSAVVVAFGIPRFAKAASADSRARASKQLAERHESSRARCCFGDFLTLAHDCTVTTRATIVAKISASSRVMTVERRSRAAVKMFMTAPPLRQSTATPVRETRDDSTARADCRAFLRRHRVWRQLECSSRGTPVPFESGAIIAGMTAPSSDTRHNFKRLITACTLPGW